MKNFVQKGDTLTLTAPYDVDSGDGFLVGSLFAVAVNDAASGKEVEGVVTGVFDLPRETGASTDFTAGAKLYWDNTNKRVTKTATNNSLIGAAALAAGTTDATARVRLNGVTA